MVECPHCNHQLEADFGMVSCPSCKNILIVDIDGHVQLGESASSAVVSEGELNQQAPGAVDEGLPPDFSLAETMMASPAQGLTPNQAPPSSLAETVMGGDPFGLAETQMSSGAGVSNADPGLAETMMAGDFSAANNQMESDLSHEEVENSSEEESSQDSFAEYQMDETQMAPSQASSSNQEQASFNNPDHDAELAESMEDWWEDGGAAASAEAQPSDEFAGAADNFEVFSEEENTVEEEGEEEPVEAEEEEEIEAEILSPELEEEERDWLQQSNATAASDSADLSEIADYGNSEASLAKDGLYFYDIRISGIDSAQEKRNVNDVLQDARFAWNGRKILGSINNGVLVIEKMSAVKASILINRLKGLNLKVQWKQNVLTQMDVN